LGALEAFFSSQKEGILKYFLKTGLYFCMKNNHLVSGFKKNKKNAKKFKKGVDTGVPNIYTATTASKGADVV